MLTATAAAAGGGGGKGVGSPPSGGGDSGVVGQVATKTLSSQICHLQQIVGDVRNEVISLISHQRKHINTLNAACVVVRPYRRQLLKGYYVYQNARGICGCCGRSGIKDWVGRSQQRHTLLPNGEQISLLSLVERCFGILLRA